jgi:hypothetical protein
MHKSMLYVVIKYLVLSPHTMTFLFGVLCLLPVSNVYLISNYQIDHYHIYGVVHQGLVLSKNDGLTDHNVVLQNKLYTGVREINGLYKVPCRSPVRSHFSSNMAAAGIAPISAL